MDLNRRARSPLLAVGVLASLAALPYGASAQLPLPSCLGRLATLVGTDGSDRIVGTPAADVIVAGGGADVVLAGDGGDRVCGGLGNDAIEGRYGRDLLSGDGGSDRVVGGPGSDLLLGGAGRDRLLGGDQRTDSDTLVGGGSADVLRGGDGDGDEDYLFGGRGNDLLDGGVGGRDRLYGGRDDDYIDGGGSGSDTASFEFAPQRVVVDLIPDPTGGPAARGEGTDHLARIESVIGSRHSDDLRGDGSGNRLRGLGGDDAISASAGEDYVDGGKGSDTLDGGLGVDLVSFDDAPRAVTARLRDQSATGAGIDSIAGFETLFGSFYDDHLTGDDAANSIWGSYGTNSIFGLGGDDYLEFGDSGDAGAGTDECIWSSLENCEYHGHFDPVSLPYISNRLHNRTVDDIQRLFGGIAGGLGGPADASTVVVSLRRMTANGCWWWERASARFERRACGVPLRNPVPVQDGRWSVPVDARLRPGSYEARVNWRSSSDGCDGAFAPMCVTFDVS